MFSAALHSVRSYRFGTPLIALITAGVLSACQTPFNLPPGEKNDQTAQAARTENTDKEVEKGSKTSQPSFSQFSDIPIPEGANMDLDQTLILGNQDGWIGRLSLKTHHGMAKMYNFYEREMPRFSWAQITVVRSTISTMTYSRGGRIATITLQPGGLSGGTSIDLTVAPGNKSE